jgi:RNA polymerase sigma-70 factor (ECF subfamily)
MSDAAPPPTFEDLLRHADWLRRLAHAVVQDDAVAEDLVQETWLSALRSPPRSHTSVRSWLRQVLKRHAYQRYRAEVARAGREAAAARPENTPGAAALVARTEVQSRVIREVLELDEPYRTTVLLRYVEELPPREVAVRTNAPVETVRARLRRARERLRERLDREDGREGAWLGALLPLVVPGPGETSTATLAATGAATAGGVLLMTTTQKIAVAVAAVLLLGAGAWLALPGRDAPAEPASAAGPDSGAVDEDARSRRRVRESPPVVVPTPPAVDSVASSSAVESGYDAPAGPPPVLVRVTVLPPAEGEPPATVPVHVRRDRPAPWRSLPVVQAVPGETVEIDVGSLLPADDSARVVVRVDHPDYLPVGDRISYARPDVRPRETEDVRLVLHPAVRLTGRVVDAGGNPVDRAAVGVFVEQDGKRPNLQIDQATTDADGRYSLRSVPSRDVVVAACAGRFLPAVRDVPGAAVATALDELTLETGVSLRARVLADGEPVDGIDVRLNPGYGRTLPLHTGNSVAVLDDGAISRRTPVGSSSGGRLTISGLLARPHRLTVLLPDAAPGVEQALVREVRPGGPEIEIDLQLARVTVRVTDSSQPLAGVDVIARIAGGGPTTRFTTDASGCIRMRALRGAAYTVEVDDPAWAREAQRLDVPEGAREHEARLVATPAR